VGHLKDIGESYVEHMYHASAIALHLIKCGFCQLIHAVLPDVKPPFKSDLNSVIDFLESKKAKNRK